MNEYDQALQAAVRRNMELIGESDVFVSLYSDQMADFLDDPLPAIQLAIAILLDKPIVVACLPGRKPTAKLRAVADVVITGPPSELAAAVQEFLERRPK